MFECRVSIEAIPQIGDLYGRVIKRFQVVAGELVVNAVKDVLGKDDLYTLSEEYAKRKPRIKGFKRVAGKDPDQPLILSGDMFENVVASFDGDTMCIQLSEGHGVDEKDD